MTLCINFGCDFLSSQVEPSADIRLSEHGVEVDLNVVYVAADLPLLVWQSCVSPSLHDRDVVIVSLTICYDLEP